MSEGRDDYPQPAIEHPGCRYTAVRIEHEDGAWYFCNKCGWGADAADIGSSSGSDV